MALAPLHGVLIVAAGRGSRAGPGEAKQYRQLCGMTVLRRTLLQFEHHPDIGLIQTVIHEDDEDLYAASAQGLSKLLPPVHGGAERQDSVRLGLTALRTKSPDTVLIHDAARPFVSEAVISAVLDALETHEAALAALPVTDTLKHSRDGLVQATQSRENLWRAQTPQGFHFSAIDNAHRKAADQQVRGLTDDAAVAEWAGLDVAIVTGEAINIKLTTQEDFSLAEAQLKTPRVSQTANEEFRTGMGYDVHRFGAGSQVTLCGVTLPHSHGLEGHSDADAPIHALTDAILGAIGEGDIGHHFPPSDPKWKGAASETFLAHAAGLVEKHGGRIVNVDVTIICQMPKIGPHREAMRIELARLLGIEPGRISVKATTTEGLGPEGRREGLAAQAAVMVALPAG